jgi:hypothetical protein
MAGSTIPEPGSVTADGEPLGPCADRHCGHRGCRRLRDLAITKCGLCERHIGFDRRYVEDDDHGTVHFACLCELYASQPIDAQLPAYERDIERAEVRS